MEIIEKENNLILVLDKDELESYNILKLLHGSIFFRDYITNFLAGRKTQYKSNLADKLAASCCVEKLEVMVEEATKANQVSQTNQVSQEISEVNEVKI